MNITGMPNPSTSNMPKVAIAFSGGGLRAMLSGAGVFDGLDSRSTTAKPNLNDGKPTVNGLLDWASYMTGTSPSSPPPPLTRPAYLGTSGYMLTSGLSGGSWLIGASAQNNYATIDTLRTKIWKKPQLIPDLSDFGFSFANMASDFARKNAAFSDLASLVDLW
jgi:lysophospholipase